MYPQDPPNYNWTNFPASLRGNNNPPTSMFKQQSYDDCKDANGMVIPCEEVQNGMTPQDNKGNLFITDGQNVKNENPIYTAPNIQPALAQVQKKESKIDPFFAMRGAINGLSWLSGKAERNRQDQYMYDQYSQMGQLDPVNINDYQPNKFSLYAKYGGKMSKYLDGGETEGPGPKKRVPIVVNSKYDPRLKAYSDSLSVHNQAEQEYRNAKVSGIAGVGKDKMEIKLSSEKTLPYNEFTDDYENGRKKLLHFNNGTNENMQPENISRFRGTGVLGFFDYYNQARYKKPEQEVLYQRPIQNQPKPKASTALVGYNTKAELDNLKRNPKMKEVFAPGGGKSLGFQTVPDKPKAVYRPQQKEVLADPAQYQARIRGTITPAYPVDDAPATPQQTQTTASETRIYGPSNGYLGDRVNGKFVPTTQRNHLAKANQADIDLLNDPEGLDKYVSQKFKKGGYINKEGRYVHKDGKSTSRPGLWSNVYMKKHKKALGGTISKLLRGE